MKKSCFNFGGIFGFFILLVLLNNCSSYPEMRKYGDISNDLSFAGKFIGAWIDNGGTRFVFNAGGTGQAIQYKGGTVASTDTFTFRVSEGYFAIMYSVGNNQWVRPYKVSDDGNQITFPRVVYNQDWATDYTYYERVLTRSNE
jgi:hypothetical protein